MGEVYLAEGINLGRKVAVKTIRDSSDDPHARARFVREAQALANVEHPNVVRC